MEKKLDYNQSENQMLEEIDSIIFDVDGTLLDPMCIWPSIDDDYLEKYHLTKPERFHENMEGMSYTEAAHYFLEVFPDLPFTPQEVMEEWMEMVYDKYMTQVELKTGAKEFIERMRDQGHLIGIATSNARELVLDMLESLGIRHLFDSVHSACEVEAGKPSPAVYLLVAEDLGVDPSRCLVFEDVPMGILAGKNAGMRVCAVEDAFSSPQVQKKRELADYYIQDYTEIEKRTYEVL